MWDVCQVDRRAMLGEASEMSGDASFVFMLQGRESQLVLLSIVCERNCCVMSVPRESVCYVASQVEP